ncbi:hypothetical protein DYI26_22095 [Halomonas litopenaei]|nr:hypothetical protein [Halomonas litopenaei]
MGVVVQPGFFIQVLALEAQGVVGGAGVAVADPASLASPTYGVGGCAVVSVVYLLRRGIDILLA